MSSPPAAITNVRTSPIWWLLLLLAAISVIGFAFAVSQRLLYPHELEWMEGALADHASRVADGLPLYCEPGPQHVPFLYAPLLFWLGGLGMKFGLDGIIALRLVAIAFSVGSAMLIGHWVRKETGRLVPGLVATGLFFAGYGWLAWWYDLARNDSLFVFLCLATTYQLRHGARLGWLWAGLLATLALLAKQSALMWLPAVGVGALCWNWRIAIGFGIVATTSMAAAIGVMHLLSEGWSTFYLFEMPQHHGWVGENKLGFWVRDLQPMWPILLLGLIGFAVSIRPTPRTALFLAAFGSGGLVCSWLSRMHVGGFDNVMMYGFAGACVLGAIAATSNASRMLRIAGPVLLFMQFAWLGYAAWQRSPSETLLPPDAHRQAHRELRAVVANMDGPVWIPAHGHIAYRLGKGTGAHGQAIFDVMQMLPKLPDGMFDLTKLANPSSIEGLSDRGQQALAALMRNVHDALAAARFAGIVIDEVGASEFVALFAAGLIGPDAQFGTNDDPYVRRPGYAIRQPKAIQPLLGYEVHSPYVFERRD